MQSLHYAVNPFFSFFFSRLSHKNEKWTFFKMSKSAKPNILSHVKNVLFITHYIKYKKYIFSIRLTHIYSKIFYKSVYYTSYPYRRSIS